VALINATGILEKWFWMRQLGYSEIFWKIQTAFWAAFFIL
jgi:hypothetical protein